MTVLSTDFFNRHTEKVARDLLGKYLCVKDKNNNLLSGVITETEAYRGFDDDASHAHKGKTLRCEVMYGPPAHAYVYFTYGLHYILNFVTEKENFPAAVLIRGIIPKDGIEIMSMNRYGYPFQKLDAYKVKNISNGPAKLTKAMGITRNLFNGLPLKKNPSQKSNPSIWVEERGVNFDESLIETTSRIGIDYAKNSKNWPLRFVYKNSF